MLRHWLGVLLLGPSAWAAEKPPTVNPAPVPSQERVVSSVVPSLDYGAACWSTLTLTNLGDRVVTVEVEPHRQGGGLVGLVGLAPAVLHLNPGERSVHRLEITDESGQGWLKVREQIPSPRFAPAIAVSALPISICPQAMPNGRPSSAVDLVKPVTPCLVVV